MRIFDCFPFFNEVDLLELRLAELWDVVDVFVIAEARQTHTGQSKPLCFPENEKRFRKYKEKIRYAVVDEFPKGTDTWARENFQRRYLKTELSDAEPDDIIVLSDLDELPRADVVLKTAKNGINPGEVCCLSLDFFCFYLNIKMRAKWERQGPRMVRAGDLKDLQGLRRVLGTTDAVGRDLIRQIKSSRAMGRWVRRIMVPDAGWHFTWMGGKEAVRMKGSSLAVHSDIPLGEKNMDWADARVKALLENDTRYDIVEVDESFPQFICENPEIFEKYILPSAEA